MPKAYAIIAVIVGFVIIGAAIAATRQNAPSVVPNIDTEDESTIPAQTNTNTTTNSTAPAATAPSSQSSPAQATTQTVRYTNSGYSPSQLTVTRGTTVTFINNSSQSMWTASDPHPIHTTYSAFDSDRGIAPGGSYSFTFDKAGSWSYHNHLVPNDRGTVTVQ